MSAIYCSNPGCHRQAHGLVSSVTHRPLCGPCHASEANTRPVRESTPHRAVLLPYTLLEDLDKVIEYNWADEEEDYLSHKGDGRHHIFTRLKRLNDWLTTVKSRTL